MKTAKLTAVRTDKTSKTDNNVRTSYGVHRPNAQTVQFSFIYNLLKLNSISHVIG